MQTHLHIVSPLALALLAGLAAGQNTDKVTVPNNMAAVSGNGNTTSLHANYTGRYAVFASTSSDLVAGDTNSVADVFVRDRRTFATVRVSVPDPSMNQSQADGASSLTSVEGARVISDDGRFVVFVSAAANLVPNDTNGVADVFVRDRDRDGNGIFDEAGVGKTKTTRVNLTSGDSQATGGCPNDICDHYSWDACISGDGRFVAWVTNAGMTADTASYSNVYVRDRDADNDGIFDEAGGTPDAATTELVSKRIGSQYNGQQGDGFSDQPAISADGRHVAFVSRSKFMVFSDVLDNDRDVYVRDTVLNTTAKVSVATDGSHGTALDATSPSVSGNGRYVVFQSAAGGLVSGDAGLSDIFLRDRDTDSDGVMDEAGAVSTTRVSMGRSALPLPGGSVVALNGDSTSPSISDDGRWVAFESAATNAEPSLLGYDTNGANDILVRDVLTSTTRRVSLNKNGTECETASSLPSISGDGRSVCFISDGDNLDGADGNGSSNRDGYVRSTLPSPEAAICSTAQPLFPGQTVEGSTLGHTADGAASCTTSNNSPDVWYALEATCDGTIEVSTTWSTMDTVLSVFTSCGGAEIACDDDNPGSFLSTVSFATAAGHTYLIRVAGFQYDAGWFVLSASECQGEVACPADYNQDGGIDGADVEAFFADWEAGMPNSDVNADGGIDGADVEAFFAAWENGGCA